MPKFSNCLLKILKPCVHLHQFRIGNSKLLSSRDLNEDWYSKLPNTEFIMNNTFWVGTFPALGEEEISRIASNIHSLINEKIGVQI